MRGAPNFSQADHIVSQAIEQGAFTSACLLVGRRERVLFRRAYGRLSMEDDAPLTSEHTRYDLASITKPLVIGMLCLRAMESGRLCLWDKLGTFIDAPADKRDITVAQILTHTAGFPTGLHLWKMAQTPEHSTELLLGSPLIAPARRAGHVLLRGLYPAGAAAGMPIWAGAERAGPSGGFLAAENAKDRLPAHGRKRRGY